MNLLLLEDNELDGGRALIRGRRAEHLRSVIGAQVGSQVRAGISRGASGTATVRADDGEAMTVEFAAEEPPRSRPDVDLVIALPRPKVLDRVVQHAASFGVDRVVIVNSWRVDKSYFDSPRMQPSSLIDNARLGCEQGRHTWVPDVVVHRRFMAWVEALPPEDSRLRVVADPRAGRRLSELAPLIAQGRTVVAIGPEGGWIDRELATFEDLGFESVILSTSILRSEVAVSVMLGQLELLAATLESHSS